MKKFGRKQDLNHGPENYYVYHSGILSTRPQITGGRVLDVSPQDVSLHGRETSF